MPTASSRAAVSTPRRGSSDRDIQGAGRETALTVGMWGSQPNTAVIRAFEDAGIVFVASDEGGGPGLRFKSNRK